MIVPENISDDELLRRSACGDESAFVMLYRRRQAGIYRYALHMCGSRIIAEDVTQEVFMALVRVEKLNYDPSRGSLSAYLYGVARHHVLRCLERDKSYVPLADEAEEENAHALEHTIASDDLAHNFARKEMIEQLHAAIDTLPAHYREVIVLCDLHELSYAEAAVVIECAIGTVRSRLHRARALLAEKLRPASRACVEGSGETEESSRAINPVGCLI